MKVSTDMDNKFGYEKITHLVDNIPLINIFNQVDQTIWLFICSELIANQTGKIVNQQVINGDSRHVPIKLL